MKWSSVEAQWCDFKGEVTARWKKLNHDDVLVLRGKRDRLRTKIEKRYGVQPLEAERQIDAWVAALEKIRSSS